MSVLAIALGAGMITILAIALIRLQLKHARDLRFRGLELKPNCLLTRYPIIFLAKPTSLFRIFEDWDDVPKYLREHGYEVLILSPVPGFELPSVVAAIEGMKSKCHLIAGGTHENLLHQIANSKMPQVTSLTYVERLQTGRGASAKQKKIDRKTTISVNDLRPLGSAVEVFQINQKAHQKTSQPWEVEGKFLEYAISLAERDAEWCD